MKIATFDLGPDVLQAIIDGNMLFAIDQAQYLQGYLPIVLLTQFLDTGALPLGSVDRVILTGPQFVTADTAADVIAALEQVSAEATRMAGPCNRAPTSFGSSRPTGEEDSRDHGNSSDRQPRTSGSGR